MLMLMLMLLMLSMMMMMMMTMLFLLFQPYYCNILTSIPNIMINYLNGSRFSIIIVGILLLYYSL